MNLDKQVSLMSAVSIMALALALTDTAFAGGAPGLSRTLPLVRPDGTTVGNSTVKNLPKGTVKLEIKGTTQRVTIDAFNLLDAYEPGLAVYIGDAPQITNATLQYVDVLSKVDTNGHWRLLLESSANEAPPQLTGFSDLTELVGRTFFVVTGQTNALLRANVSELLPKPSQLSYRRRVPLAVVDPTLSARAGGYILAKYNGRTGGSVLTVRARGLNKGNRYVARAPDGEPVADVECQQFGFLAVNGTAVYGYDSSKGDELPFGGSDADITTVLDLAGIPLVVVDCFGGEHLAGTIPGP